MSPVTKRKAEQADAGFLTLRLGEIRAYERDPRHSANPEYARIKASILAQGLDQPLIVSRRPGDTQYIVAAGGNTRLRVLSELYTETGDPKFNAIACVYKPWEAESAILLAHIRENDLRGGLTLCDKARAIREIRELLKVELGLLQPSRAEYIQLFKAKGYALSQGSLSLFDYLVDELLPLLPLAVEGLSWDGTESIRKLHRAARALWTAGAVASCSAAEFEQSFGTLCRRYDSVDWDIKSLRQALEAELADRLNQTVHMVRLALDAQLEGRAGVELPARDADADEWPVPQPKKIPGGQKPDSPCTASALRDGTAEPADDDDNDATVGDDDIVDPDWSRGSSTAERDRIAPQETLPSSTKPLSTARPTMDPRPTDDALGVADLRRTVYECALRLAERHGLGDLISDLPTQGTGYLVRDVPDPTLFAQLDEEGLAQTSMLWWQLLACADITVAPVERWLPHLRPDSVLYRALQAQDAVLLFNAVWTIDPGQLGFRLWRNLEDPDWNDLVKLMTCYRALHRHAEASGQKLWEMAT